MRNVRIQVSYDGSRFYGWQRQDGFDTVQQALEEALEALLGESITVRGSGRTDTGVHALRQVANFHLDCSLDDNRLWHALNAHLPGGVVIRRLETCEDGFHAQYDACGKRYLYLVQTERFRPPFARRHSHWVREKLDFGAMREAAGYLIGTQDFRAFANAGSPRKTTVRRLSSVRLIRKRDRFAIVMGGSGFLYRMARVIAGTLIEVGRGQRTAAEVGRILADGDRSLAGATAPPEGLYLLSVRYPGAPFRS